MTFPQHKDWNRTLLGLSLLLTLLAYLPLANNQFVNWDDPNYILFNPHIRNLNFASLQWMFTHFQVGYWIPLTWLSFALDFGIGRLEPWVYHLDNLVLHLLNTAVIFQVSLQLLSRTGKTVESNHLNSLAAFGTALLFGLHPIHVESVAWATERKDLLSGLFFLLSLWFYFKDASLPQPRRRDYFACLGFFILALLSKPMAVSLPLVFILLDYWPLKRFQTVPAKVWKEKVPFLILALLSSGITLWSQYQAGAAWGLGQSPLSFRVLNACHSLIFYLVKMVVPLHLAAFYPILLENTFSPAYLASALAVVLLSLVCFLQRQKRPYLAAAWVYYLLTLAPVLGIIQVGNQAAGDRFTYLPAFGPILLGAAALVHFLSGRQKLLLAVALAWALLLGYGTFRQLGFWKDSISLWENVLRIYPNNNLIVHNNLGKAYEEACRFDDALVKFQDADVPGIPFFYAHWGKARILAQKKRFNESIEEFKNALVMNPNFPPLYAGLGMVDAQVKKQKEALAEIHEALRIDPHYGDAYADLGMLEEDQGRLPEAITAFQNAGTLDPDNPSYLKKRIRAYEKAGQYREALTLYQGISTHPRSLLTLTF